MAAEPTERHQIDVDYTAAVQAAEQEEAAHRAYERQRDDWVWAHAPDLAGSSPIHECLIVQPGPTGAEIEFEELDLEGRICAARSPADGRCAFGTTEEVIASVTGRPPDHPWLAAVCRALHRERIWDGSRRWTLVVDRGAAPQITPAGSHTVHQAWPGQLSTASLESPGRAMTRPRVPPTPAP